MKEKLFTLVVTMLIPMIGMADEYTDPSTNIVYTYTKGSGEAGIFPLGTFDPGDPAPVDLPPGEEKAQKVEGDLVILEKFAVDGLEYVVKTISARSFQRNTEITSVVIPNTVISIGVEAFYGCKNLASVTFPQSLETIESGTFRECENLLSVDLPNCTSVKEYAFMGCLSLKTVRLGCCTISNDAFKDCTELTSVTFNNGTNDASIASSAFANSPKLSSVTLSEGMVSIGSSAFINCMQLTEITIPQSVTSIGSSAFSGCKNLQSLTIKDAEASIEKLAFYNCERLKNVDLGQKIVAIGERSFESCVELESITLPGTVSEIGHGAFSRCDALSAATIGDGVKTIGSSAFADCKNLSSLLISSNLTKIGASAFSNCYGLVSIKIPDGVTEIEEEAFNRCKNLESVEMPAGMVNIPYRAFYDCTNLRYVKLSPKLENVGEGAFSGCAMTAVTIPATTKTIGAYAYSYEALRKVVSELIEPFEIEVGTFGDDAYHKATLVVPVGTVEKYKSTPGWRDFEEIVEMGSEPQTAFTVNVEQEGSLGDLITALNASKIRKLVVKGRLNGTDIKFLRSSETVIEYLDSLDLKDVTLVPGGESYYTYVIPGEDGDYWSNSTYYIYLSDHEEKTFLGITAVGLGTQSKSNWESDALPYAFYGLSIKQIVLPSSLNKLGEKILGSCRLLEDVETSEKITYIQLGAFSGCEKLRRVSGLDFSSVETIEDQAFEGCKALEIDNLNLSNVIKIGESAFFNCQKINRLIISDKTKSVGCGAFGNCTSLVSISYDSEAATTYGIDSFDDWWMDTLPVENGIVYMGKTAMRLEKGVSTPTSLKFRDNTLCIAHGFSESLESKYVTQIELPATLKRIGDYAFSNCDKLNSLTIPSSVVDLGSCVFSGDSVISMIQKPFPIADDTFNKQGSLKERTLIVPAGTKDDYCATEGWNLFTNIIESKPLIIEKETISIGKNGKATYTGAKALDFSGYDDLKAYVATGYESNGTIWLTCVKQVPANTPIFIKGEADQTYEVPVMGKCDAYYENMFKGSADEDVIISATSSDGKYKNFYMAGGVFKPASASQKINAGKAYLQVPANFKDAKAGEDQIVKIADSGKSSYAPPVDVDLTEVDGLKAYAATGYDAATSTIWLTRINKIQAGEGVLLKGEAGKEYTLPSAEVQAYYGNMFVGNINEKITIGETSDDGEWTNYYLASGSFKKVSGTREIGTNKSYLHLPTSLLVSSARGKKDSGIDEWLMEELETETVLLGGIGGDDDGTTRIDAISIGAQSDVYYNLQGQRVENPMKGLYIRNGVKVVIRSTTK